MRSRDRVPQVGAAHRMLPIDHMGTFNWTYGRCDDRLDTPGESLKLVIAYKRLLGQ